VGYYAGETSQGAAAVAVGRDAGKTSQGIQAVAVGRLAGETSQGLYAVAVGDNAGQTSQGTNATAVGRDAGKTGQGVEATAVGYLAGCNVQGAYATAVGVAAGRTGQGSKAVAVGVNAGMTSQAGSAVAVGYGAGLTGQGKNTVAVGQGAGQTGQGSYATAVGDNAGQTSQGVGATAVGVAAGFTGQGAYTTAVGHLAGYTSQGTQATAVGIYAGQYNQGSYAVAVGSSAGMTGQGTNATAVGLQAGSTGQGASAVAVGHAAGSNGQGAESVAVGLAAGYTGQGAYATAVGGVAGQYNQAAYAVAVGYKAGSNGQKAYTAAVGFQAGQTNQGIFATALGSYCGENNQGDFGTIAGHASGRYNQGVSATAIGRYAGVTNQASESTVINSVSSVLNNTVAGSLKIRPIRNINGSATIYMFRHSSDEITWGAVSSDDRLKINETLITNAVSTLMKLRPEKYDKLLELNGHSSNTVPEFGLIAQEVWYNTPELRILVSLGTGAVPDETVDIPDDPQQDPDYSSWGTRPAGFDYDGLIPWLIKGIQEIHNELPRHRTKIPSVLYSNISQCTGMIVSKSPTISLSNVVNDKSYFGIVTDKPLDTKDSEILVQSTGEGYIWVTDVNGPIESGDLITTSNIAGHGMKQNDDFVHSYTVAKSSMHCDFNPQQVPIKRIVQQLSNVNYWTFTDQIEIAESDYDLFTENKRNTITINYYSCESGIITEDKYNQLEPSAQSEYKFDHQETKYYKKEIREFTTDPNDDVYTLEVRQELVDVLDENGQIVWEDTTNTVPAYTLVDHGTYKAALVSCKLI